MPFLVVKPEPSGHPGTGTIVEADGDAPVVRDLHYVFDWWVGDDLVGSYPFFLVTERLRASLAAIGDASGFAFAGVQVTSSEFFRRTSPEKSLPGFCWLQVHGSPGIDDMGLSRDHALVVSGRVLAVLLDHALEQADISQFRTR
ncbi:MAG TPA: hypothetical protein VJU18_09990 [Vicinamibacteria bacterium]|nr:hypothetical protein [Vicinamibacteria bacterium]